MGQCQSDRERTPTYEYDKVAVLEIIVGVWDGEGRRFGLGLNVSHHCRPSWAKGHGGVLVSEAIVTGGSHIWVIWRLRQHAPFVLSARASGMG